MHIVKRAPGISEDGAAVQYWRGDGTTISRAGVWLTLSCVPPSWGWWLAGFVVFRVFDIFKPWPINVIDRKIAGGLGVMLDDLLAGVGAWAVMMMGLWLL